MEHTDRVLWQVAQTAISYRLVVSGNYVSISHCFGGIKRQIIARH